MRRNLALLIAAVLLALVFVRLGLWQLDRRAQRRARNAVARAALARPPVVLPPPPGTTTPASADSVLGRLVRARGRYDFTGELVWQARSYEATPGVWLLTPLRLADGSTVLVNRGWMPAPDGRHFDTAAARGGEPEAASITGLAVALPAQPALGAPALPAGNDFLPFMLQRLPDGGRSGVRWPLPIPPPTLDEGPHLAYALQWFAFAAIAVGGAILLVARRQDVQLQADNRRA